MAASKSYLPSIGSAQTRFFWICDKDEDLPATGVLNGEIAIVLATRILHKRNQDRWISIGGSANWNTLDEKKRYIFQQIEKMDFSPSSGMCKITNMYVNPETGKLVVEYNNTPIE